MNTLKQLVAWLLLSSLAVLLVGYVVLVVWQYPAILLFVGFLAFVAGCGWAAEKVADIMGGR